MQEVVKGRQRYNNLEVDVKANPDVVRALLKVLRIFIKSKIGTRTVVYQAWRVGNPLVLEEAGVGRKRRLANS